MSPPPPPPSPLAPAPPLLSQAWSLSPPCAHSYTWYTGVSQNNFLKQKYLALNFEKTSPNLLFSAAWRPYIFATPYALNALPSLLLNTQESFSFFLLPLLFSPFPNECQLFMPKDFLEPPCLTLLGVSLVL